ncbi:MAG: transposase [Acetobacter sp.]|jgi:transposase|nr:transposase [Acetobacter sp.]MCH4060559.1 transposase [Acetobacter sp.]MCH4087499.1 transposase [Acetobacter sp.]MCI1294700.1 transposase [Acetobacter sp.]MCI1321151.1 transposase [Acetobacter sp.]
MGFRTVANQIAPDPIWLTEEQLMSVIPFFPRATAHSVKNLAFLSAVVYILRTGWQWKYLPDSYGLKFHPVYTRFVRWSENGVLDRILSYLTITIEGRNVVAVTPEMLKRHPSAKVLIDNGCFPGMMEIAED